jgi:Na+/melibiose symporter-like transporter
MKRERAAEASWRAVCGQVGELLAVAVVGAGASNLDKPAGIAAFGGGLSVAVILLVVRIAKGPPGL